MIEVNRCVICDGPIKRLKRALVAPFLAERIWNREPFLVDLVRCYDCTFLFYNPRLDDEELQQLYRGYRLHEYQRMRQTSEPWYTEKFNDQLASANSYQLRRAKLAALLERHIDTKKICRVLDYGGDRGDLVAGLFENAQAFVYEISGIEATAGVQVTMSPSSCEPDLTINSNVLEHVGFPRQLVEEILRGSRQSGLVYLEVPAEHPFEIARILRRIAQTGIVSLASPKLAIHLLSPATLYMMHEHINYYSERTLAALLLAAGGRVIASGQYSLDRFVTYAYCLGSKETR